MTSPLTLRNRVSPGVVMPGVGVGMDIPTGTGWSVECGKCVMCEDWEGGGGGGGVEEGKCASPAVGVRSVWAYLEEIEDLFGQGLNDEPGASDDHEAEGLSGNPSHEGVGAGSPALLSPGAQ